MERVIVGLHRICLKEIIPRRSWALGEFGYISNLMLSMLYDFPNIFMSCREKENSL